MKKIFVILFGLLSLGIFAENISVEKMDAMLKNTRENMNCIGYDVFEFDGSSKEKVLINYQNEFVVFIDYELKRIQAWVAPKVETNLTIENIKDFFICQDLPEDNDIKLYRLGE